jgi:hypothetical protein
MESVAAPNAGARSWFCGVGGAEVGRAHRRPMRSGLSGCAGSRVLVVSEAAHSALLTVLN